MTLEFAGVAYVVVKCGRKTLGRDMSGSCSLPVVQTRARSQHISSGDVKQLLSSDDTHLTILFIWLWLSEFHTLESEVLQIRSLCKASISPNSPPTSAIKHLS